MEHFGKDSTGNLKLTEDDTHLLDACHGLRSPYADACYFYGPTSYLGRHTDDFTGALTWCRALGGGSNCIRGVGSRAMKYHIDEPSYSWKLCAGLSNSEKGICTDGAIGYLLVHTESFQPAKDFCATLTGDDRSLCDAAILKRRHWFD